MRKKIKILQISLLKSHEAIDFEKLNTFIGKLKKDGCIRNPVIVDNKHFIIIDGHYRTAALKKLGAKKIPTVLVDYKNDNIKVYLRRKLFMQIVKDAVVDHALNNNVFPEKTTRHFIKKRIRNINMKLDKLGV